MKNTHKQSIMDLSRTMCELYPICEKYPPTSLNWPFWLLCEAMWNCYVEVWLNINQNESPRKHSLFGGKQPRCDWSFSSIVIWKMSHQWRPSSPLKTGFSFVNSKQSMMPQDQKHILILFYWRCSSMVMKHATPLTTLSARVEHYFQM